MEAASEGENKKNSSGSPIEGQKKPKRQMKTPYQLEILEKTYALEMYPSEATRAELSEKLGLSDKQLQMWFCHKRLKNKKELRVKKARAAGAVGKTGLFDSARDELMVAEPESDHGSISRSRSRSRSRSGSGSGQFDYGDDVPIGRRYYESPSSVMEHRVIACVEEQLGEPLREDGPILGMEFDEVPPGAFEAPIVMTKQRDQSGLSYEGKSFQQCDFTTNRVSVPAEALQSSWMENCRKNWGIKLHASFSAKDLLQILMEFEAVIKRGCLLTKIETTEELLASSALSGRGVC